jgi:hypothetical protein
MMFVNGTKVDERVIRTDLDPGFRENRQYGRGKGGGQVTIFNFLLSFLKPHFYSKYVLHSN